MMMSSYGAGFSFLFLLFLAVLATGNQLSFTQVSSLFTILLNSSIPLGFVWVLFDGVFLNLLFFQSNGSVAEMVPLIEEGKMNMMEMNETRRRLGSFQICAPCTCCGGAKGLCLPSPCCYAINCNIPNRPFGFCSFTPKSCNCFGCNL